jgi:hypothetical protein
MNIAKTINPDMMGWDTTKYIRRNSSKKNKWGESEESELVLV